MDGSAPLGPLDWVLLAALYLVALALLGRTTVRRRLVEGAGLVLLWLLSAITAVGFFGWLYIALPLVGLAATTRHALTRRWRG